MQRSLTTLRRHSTGHQILDEAVSNIGAMDTFGMITNVNECEDGVYEVTTCNLTHDYETGCVDGYDFVLIPYDPTHPNLQPVPSQSVALQWQHGDPHL